MSFFYIHPQKNIQAISSTKYKILLLLFLTLLFISINGCKKDNADDNNNNGNGPWTELGVGYFNASIFTVCTDPAGNLYAAGAFTNSNGKYFVAKWDGIAWSELGTLDVDQTIISICSDAAGNIYASGFSNSNFEACMAIWNGSSWSISTSPVIANEGWIDNLTSDGAGNIYATGSSKVFKYNGTWEAVSMTGWPHWTNGLLVAGGNLYVAGGALTGGTLGAIGVWNGNGWSYIGDINSYEQAYNLAMDVHGNLYASGGFDFQSGYVLKWNGSTWTDLGLNGNDIVNTLSVSTSGKLYAGGEFANANNKFYVAKWNGTSFSEEGAGNFSSSILASCAGTGGKVYFAGNFYRHIDNSNKYFIAVYSE